MKTIFRVFATLLLIVGLAVVAAFATGNVFLIKGVWAVYLHGHKSATIDDHRFFDTRTIAAGNHQPWPEASTLPQQSISSALTETLESSRSVAFLVIKDGAIAYENYWDGYNEASHSNSFSMAKTITALLVQQAIQDGFIQSWDEPVINYLPKITGPFREELTLRHLVTMTAGLDWNEHYTNPFDITARTYYGPDVQEDMYERVAVTVKPGSTYEYQSGATQYLGMALQVALDVSISEYASQKLWKPLGAQHDALWHLDNEDGMELTYCCFNSNARDFARLGLMVNHYGKWNGQSLVDSSFIAEAIQGYKVPFYGHSFWVDNTQNTPIHCFRGKEGQYIISIPERNLVIVRLGHTNLPKVAGERTKLQAVMVDEVLKAF